MSHVYTSRKHPSIAGILSVIPGLGQIYNEQTGKGLFMFLLFVGTFLFFVLGLTPMSFLPRPELLSLDGYSPHGYEPFRSIWFVNYRMSHLARIYPILWFMVLLPFFVIFSITDAVQTARRINLGFANPNPVPPNSPPPAPGYTAPTEEQDNLRREAQMKMGNPAMAGATQAPTQETLHSSPNPSQEETMSSQNPNPQSSAQPSAAPVRSRGVSGKFLVGMIMMIIGGICILDQWHIPIFEWATWDRIWPIIPLFFGLRLLTDYQQQRDRGQFILGSAFTLVGVVYLLENWRIFEALKFIQEFWMFLLFGLGVFFMILDLIERKRGES